MEKEQSKRNRGLLTKCVIVSVAIYIVLCLVSLFFVNLDSDIWEARGWRRDYYLSHEVIRFNVSVAKYYFGLLPLYSCMPSVAYLVMRYICGKILYLEKNVEAD